MARKRPKSRVPDTRVGYWWNGYLYKRPFTDIVADTSTWRLGGADSHSSEATRVDTDDAGSFVPRVSPFSQTLLDRRRESDFRSASTWVLRSNMFLFTHEHVSYSQLSPSPHVALGDQTSP